MKACMDQNDDCMILTLNDGKLEIPASVPSPTLMPEPHETTSVSLPKTATRQILPGTFPTSSSKPTSAPSPKIPVRQTIPGTFPENSSKLLEQAAAFLEKDTEEPRWQKYTDRWPEALQEMRTEREASEQLLGEWQAPMYQLSNNHRGEVKGLQLEKQPCHSQKTQYGSELKLLAPLQKKLT
ncbi:hypothetical protein BGX38DRAFT_295336 [Terfezia claveryi]|nr:hypothetical protein BGX38DRAFT_295336 [Terfezia claveryi]